MRYGNTIKELTRMLAMGFIIGLLGAVVAAAFGIFKEHLPAERLIYLLFMPVGPPAIMGVFVFPTLLFSIHLYGDNIEHRFLDRWILSQAPIKNFERMGIGEGGWGAVIHLAGERKIRFIGAYLPILYQLEMDLEHYNRRHKKESHKG